MCQRILLVLLLSALAFAGPATSDDDQVRNAQEQVPNNAAVQQDRRQNAAPQQIDQPQAAQAVVDQAATVAEEGPPPTDQQIAKARGEGLAWLAEHQEANGSWGKQYTVAVTSFVILAHLAADDEPFVDDQGRMLVQALKFLMDNQKDGTFVHQGHTWIHGQGFAALALSEAYGRSLTCKAKPDLDMDQVRGVVEKAVAVIAKHQSTSGGWWYQPGSPSQHEGSTTVCAVQALVSANNFDIAIDDQVLARGFEYLKKCQNKDGGFDYMMGPGETSMKEGTAGGVSTLGLMKKFDYSVMMNGYKFLLKVTPHAISGERFPYYGHFYGIMGMRLLRQEFKSFADNIDGYVDGAKKDLLGWQRDNGSWPVMRWVQSSGGENDAYATAFATLTLSIDEGRLSIFNRFRPGEERRRRG